MSIQPKQLRELLSQYPANLLDLAIASLAAAADWTESDIVRSVDPNRVLAEAWHPGRLNRCRRLLADGKQAPAIRVVGYRFRCLTLFGVIDGMHRTIAHREAGKRIKAKIEGYHSIEPQRYLLWRDCLWRVSNGSGDGFIFDQKCCEILRALGVATEEQSANKNCPTFLRWDNLGQKR